MSYIKISDPSIIDLSGIQQIISVVNQHSDYLNILINRFGAVVTPDWSAENVQSLFDVSTTNIAFGKAIIKPGSPYQQGSGGSTYYVATVDFESGVTFSQVPLVLVSHDNSDGQVGGQLDIIPSTHDISTTGFTARIVRAGTTKVISNNIEINYIAIGRR